MEKQVKDLENRPDPVIYAQLQARLEGLQEIVREKDRSIERLENDLKTAGQREEDLKHLHNNYMLQIQSLINQRAISAPSGSRTTKEAIRKNQEENRKSQEEIKKPSEKEEQDQQIEKICKDCNQPFFTDNPRREYCSRKCKDANFRRNKKERN